MKQDSLQQCYSGEVNAACRTCMMEWCQQVATLCYNYNSNTTSTVSETTNTVPTELLEHTLSLVDRYHLALTNNEVIGLPPQALTSSPRTLYQYVCVTALYVSSKIHQVRVLSLQLLVSLCKTQDDEQQQLFSESDIRAMEVSLLLTVQWRVNAPTATAFCTLLLESLQPSLSQNQQPFALLQLHEPLRSKVSSLALEQVQLSITDVELLGVPKHVIAYAAVMNAMESCCRTSSTGKQNNEERVLRWTGAFLAHAVQLDTTTTTTTAIVQNRLGALVQAVVAAQLAAISMTTTNRPLLQRRTSLSSLSLHSDTTTTSSSSKLSFAASRSPTSSTEWLLQNIQQLS